MINWNLDQNCPTLEPIKNGNISTVPGSEGDLIVFTCHEGYTLVGASVLFCDEEGNWNSTQPLCLGQSVNCNVNLSQVA